MKFWIEFLEVLMANRQMPHLEMEDHQILHPIIQLGGKDLKMVQEQHMIKPEMVLILY